MRKDLLFPAGTAESCRYASLHLENGGYCLTDHPSPDITHLLLDIPSFNTAGYLTDGSDLKELLRMLPDNITVIGGNLDSPLLSPYQKIDLLKDSVFLAKNAVITAECALQVAAPYMKFTFSDSPVLILGWGRIGKKLACLLSSLGSPVTIAARKEEDRALLEAHGYGAIDFHQIQDILPKCRILFNTVPVQSVSSKTLDLWKDIIKIDLASFPGMVCENVITARGLPGKYAPESAGRLIAETVCRLMKEESV